MAKDTESYTENSSSLFFNLIHDDNIEIKDCDYCRESEHLLESDGIYYMGGFTSHKFRVDDFEKALDRGVCRSGTFFYFRN
jgi:hypothetical protein